MVQTARQMRACSRKQCGHKDPIGCNTLQEFHVGVRRKGGVTLKSVEILVEGHVPVGSRLAFRFVSTVALGDLVRRLLSGNKYGHPVGELRERELPPSWREVHILQVFDDLDIVDIWHAPVR